MSTRNLGRMSPVHEGVWSDYKWYTALDVVVYRNDTYIATSRSFSSAPSSNPEYWGFLSDGSPPTSGSESVLDVTSVTVNDNGELIMAIAEDAGD